MVFLKISVPKVCLNATTHYYNMNFHVSRFLQHHFAAGNK